MTNPGIRMTKQIRMTNDERSRSMRCGALLLRHSDFVIVSLFVLRPSSFRSSLGNQFGSVL